MDKQKQIEEMAKIIKPIIVTSYVLCNVNSKHRADEQIKRDKIKNATALYNAGYRKTFTSSLASDVQAAYKEGRNKGLEDCGEVREQTVKEIADWLDNEKGYCGLGDLIKQRFCTEGKV